MNGVDRADQLRVYYNTQRVHLKSWKPLWHWLLDTIVVNCYKLSFHAQHYDNLDLPCERYTKQRLFRQDLARELFKRSERLTDSHYDKAVPLSHLVYPAEEDDEHVPYNKGTENHCKACEAAGRKVKARYPASMASRISKKPLSELSINSVRCGRRFHTNRPPKTRSGCSLCGVALCRQDDCWSEHLIAAREAASR